MIDPTELEDLIGSTVTVMLKGVQPPYPKGEVIRVGKSFIQLRMAGDKPIIDMDLVWCLAVDSGVDVVQTMPKLVKG